MPTDDRDQQFERALARHFSNASPDSACPDAETLAAYHERALSLEEMARCKEHVAACVRCQESLALVEQTENLPMEEWEHQNELPSVMEHMALSKSALAARAHIQHNQELPSATPLARAMPAQISKMPPRPPWRWILPVGAIAASVIVWIGVREIRTRHLQQLGSAQMAQNRPSASQLPQPRYDASDQLSKEQPPAEKVERETLQQKLPATVRPNKVSPARSESSAGDTASQSENALAVQEQKDMGTPGLGGRLATPQPTAPTASYAAKARSMEAAAPPPARPPAPATSTPNTSADEKKREAQSKTLAESTDVTAAAPAQNVASAQVASVKAGYTADLVHQATTNRRLIVAPGEKQAWRLGDAGKIERSSDRGKTWRPQQSGVTADLTAGSATSDKVCWVIGKSGTLLLTTDGGKHWMLLYSPIPDDLGGIHATDALHATIWDVPNRKSFETSDGGATWYRTANE
ncbi:MAG TPA: hypothetical protein VJX72_04955 [Candidatus Acidoferrum sp.]|nr:hypothetical protein [Candidatus Acidoferrum sp.]